MLFLKCWIIDCLDIISPGTYKKMKSVFEWPSKFTMQNGCKRQVVTQDRWKVVTNHRNSRNYLCKAGGHSRQVLLFIFHYRWKTPSPDELLQYVKETSLPQSSFSAGEVSQMLASLTRMLHMNANFNSVGLACGTAIVNFAQQLADLERGLNVPSQEAETTRPYCKVLTAGNEEEPENTFVAYASNTIQDWRS